MKCLRSAKGIKVGDKFRYRSRGLYLDGAWVNRGADYDVEVIQVTDHLITLRMTIDQLTMQGSSSVMGDPKPYNWSIRKIDVGTSERLFLLEE